MYMISVDLSVCHQTMEVEISKRPTAYQLVEIWAYIFIFVAFGR